MSYATVVAGLHERFATVSGIGPILDYEPSGIQANYTLYSILDSFEVVPAGQVTAMRYTIRHRLCVYWQDIEQAELQLMPFVNSIPAAVAADRHLGGRLTSGIAEITGGDAGWVKIDNIWYRYIDVMSETLEK